MTKDQASLLLYLETCLVDYGGKVENCRINSDDFAQVELWNVEGFMSFGRLWASEAFNTKRSRLATHWVLFSEEAWKEAYKLRRERSVRLAAKVNRNDLSGEGT